ENRESNIYGLVVAKGGHKMKETASDQATPVQPAPGGIIVGAGSNQMSVSAGQGGTIGISSTQNGAMKMTPLPDGQIRMEIEKSTMPQLVDMLTPLVDRPVVDMTDLKGSYQLNMDLSLEPLL